MLRIKIFTRFCLALTILLFFSSPLFAYSNKILEPTHACQHCYEQRATLYAHCLVSDNLKRYNREWCWRIHIGLVELGRTYKACDKLTDNYLSTLYLYPQKKLPYDACETCYNNTNQLKVFCFQAALYEPKVCQAIDRCVSKLYQSFKNYPFVVAENFDGK